MTKEVMQLPTEQEIGRVQKQIQIMGFSLLGLPAVVGLLVLSYLFFFGH